MSGPKFTLSNSSFHLGSVGSVGGAQLARYARDYSFDDLILSENHKHFGNRWNGGGPFCVQHKSLTNFPSSLVSTRAGSLPGFGTTNSLLVPNSASYPVYSAMPPLPDYTHNGVVAAELAASIPKGTIGWKRARPGNPTAGVTNFLWELRDLPTLPLRHFLKLKSFKALGSEYLNVQFGWFPFVNDIKKMYMTYRNLSKSLDQLVKDNGKGIRRKRDLGTTTSVVSNTSRLNNLGMFSPLVSCVTNASNYSQLDVDVLNTEHYWFVGRFRYYVPDIGSDQWTRRATAALFGVNPTPAVLWEALPWSWLIDWFSNVGDVVSNISSNAVDNLVAEYAYVMHHKTVETRLSVSGLIAASSLHGAFRPCAAISDKTEIKSRMPATPYGFGVNFDTLSAYQLSILSALGMSRSRF